MKEVKLEPFQKILIRTGTGEWCADFYSHYNNKNFPVVTTAGRVTTYDDVLPYNDETAHLLGTTDSPTPPEPEFKWGDHVEVRNDEDEQWRKAVFCSIGQHNYFYCLIEPSGCCLWALCRHADW